MLLDSTLSGFRKGMVSSLAMDWSSLGAPVRDWRPAPKVERKEPTSMTLGCGTAMLPSTRLPPRLCPNLSKTLSISRRSNHNPQCCVMYQQIWRGDNWINHIKNNKLC